MEPTSTAAIALATIFFSKAAGKAAEKSGENLGQFLSDKAENLIKKLKGRFSINIDSEEGRRSLFSHEGLLELKALAEQDSELARLIEEVATEANKESNPQFQELLRKFVAEVEQLKPQQPTIQNSPKSANNIGFYNQGTVTNPIFYQNF